MHIHHHWTGIAPAHRGALSGLAPGDRIVARRPSDHMRAVVLDVVDDGLVVEVEAF